MLSPIWERLYHREHIPRKGKMILDRFRLDGQVAMVTGATRGLGQAIAIALAEAGADVAGLGRSEPAGTGRTVEALGCRFLGMALDLETASVAGLDAAVGRVCDGLGRIDILINNAGTIRRAPALEYSERDWDDILQINLKSAFFLAQSAARRMAARGGGKIVNVVSLLSFQGGILVPAYAAAKHALAGITRALANELAAKNINVNAVAPGYMVTDNTVALRADPVRSRAILERIPAGRWGTPEDLVGAVLLLASPASDYMHGAIVPVDGGWLSR